MTQNNDDQKPGYEIGYKRPPKHTQFQPGHTGGNRKGRPKKSSGNLASSVQAAGGKAVTVDKNGQKIRMPMRDVIASGIATRAAKGNAKDVALFAKLDKAPVASLQTAEKPVTSPMQASRTVEEASAAYYAALQRAKNPDE